MPTESDKIPKWILFLIHSLCREELHEEIEGNLIEYKEGLKKNSMSSNMKFIYQALTYLRLSTIKAKSHNSKYFIMFNFNLTQTIRSLWMHKSTTFLNVGGYALGMLCVLLLYFYVKGETSYDKFHTNGDSIYRVIRVSEMNGEKYKIGVTSGPFAPHLSMEFPSEIKRTMRVLNEEGLMEYENKTFQEDRIFFADKDFFNFFSFPLLVGDPNTVLEQPNSIVLTKKSALKYFGAEDPIGKTLIADRTYKFIVTGIVDDYPMQSHLEFDFVAALELYETAGLLDRWWGNMLATYLEIESPVLAESVQEKFPWFIDKYFGKDFEKSGKRVDITLESFNDIYFNSDIRYDWVKHGNKQAVILLAVVAIAILFIACFNYLNLSIALTFKRAREFGMRKVLGGNRSRLIFQFLGESTLVAAVSIGIAIGLTELLLPSFNAYFELTVVTSWLDKEVIMFFASLLLLTVVLSGLYPALILSSFKPLAVLKGQTTIKRNNLLIRKGLVIAQFVISIFMIIATLMIGEQLDYLNNKSLGFDREAILMVDLENKEIRQNRDNFKERLLQDPRILSMTTASGQPGGFHDATTVNFVGDLESSRMRTAFVDLDYLKTFGIKLLAGRDFSDQYRLNDAEACLINKKAVKELGLSLDEAIGTKFTIPMWDTLVHEIVGVTDDYHFLTLKENIEPLMIVPGQYHRLAAIRLESSKMIEALRVIEEVYAELAPNYPISYEFLDESLARLYEEEQKQGKIFQAFSGISIFLACLGIFGLVSFVVERRRKEFGIRKALGADIGSLLRIISKEFILMIGVASMIAVPLSWYAIQHWLENFAYRIELVDFWIIFLIGALLALFLALLTILVRSLNTARANPTESLRYE
ncbi:MAG: ABC transporter permease [Reichenbachiella sp.]|uniref:ABC transporter permease n=1 Tax=Reichenbachiella sp. TaxID=2184521 RepID=UPI003265BFC3